MSEKITIEGGDQPDGSAAPAAETPKRRRRAAAKDPGEAGAEPAPKRRARKPRAADPVGADQPAPPVEAGQRVRPEEADQPAPPAVDIPIGGTADVGQGVRPAAESFYEVELEVRNKAEQHEGQDAAMGDIAASVLRLIGDNLRRMTDEQTERVREMLGGTDLADYLDPNFWQGIGMVLQYQVQEQVDFVKRRLRGEYSVDPYGMDRDMIEVVRPFMSFMYRTWWRVQSYGIENVPAEGRALLVANHSGVLPWDGAMISSAVASEHPVQPDRVVRSLHLHWFSTLPFVAPALAATGQVPGLPENAVRLLENDELVCVFPEGLKGVGKLYKDRYKLARFGRGGFVQAALRARAPIVPVAVVGAEEIYPMLYNAESLAKMLGFPYFPVTPLFPWFGLLGVIPLPSRWSITFCPPIPTEEYGPRAADDPLTVLELAERVRDTIQETIDARLAERTSIF